VAKDKDKGRREETLLRTAIAALFVFPLLAAPAFAGETCDQAFKDTTTGSKAAIIGPKETDKVAGLLKQAEPLCKGDAKQQAEGLELLRLARSVIGE
jgi:hypothetical protein